MPGLNIDTKLLLHLNENYLDTSPSGHIVSPFGTPIFDNVNKKFGSASISLNGANQGLNANDSPDWDVIADISENWTIDCWVKHSSVPDNDRTYLSMTETANDGFLFRHSSVALEFFAFNPSIVIRMDNSTGPTQRINDTNWHHVALIKVSRGSTADYGIYLDGQQVNAVIGSTVEINFTGPIGIGYWVTRNIHFMDGNIDEFRIQKSNYFNANPNIGKTDTIIIPNKEYSQDLMGTNTQAIIIA